MSAQAEMGARREALEKSAVAVSFWIGGIGLVALKGAAYVSSGSGLVRAAMFESIGDVLSGVILWVTQARVADASNRHAYPVGKRRITPLGVLFFAAFALSAMTGLALESVQGMFTTEEAPEITPESALRRLFTEKPRLRHLLHPRKGQVETVIAEYSGSSAGDADGSDDGQNTGHTLTLLCGCIVTKFVCLIWCSRVAKRTNSEIARTFATDHFNDVISNSTVLAVMLLIAWARGVGYQSVWLDKVDPASSFLLSVWIAYNWYNEATEQIMLLSNHRVDAEVGDAIAAAARKHLEAGLLDLCEVNAYHAGRGCAAELHLQLKDDRRATGAEIAKAMESVEQAVLEVDHDVCEVYTRLRPSKSQSNSSPATQQDHSWVSQYP